jgi:hypothetical protein
MVRMQINYLDRKGEIIGFYTLGGKCEARRVKQRRRLFRDRLSCLRSAPTEHIRDRVARRTRAETRDGIVGRLDKQNSSTPPTCLAGLQHFLLSCRRLVLRARCRSSHSVQAENVSC